MNLALAGLVLSAVGSLLMALPALYMGWLRAQRDELTEPAKSDDVLRAAERVLLRKILRGASIELRLIAAGLAVFAAGQVILLANHLLTPAAPA